MRMAGAISNMQVLKLAQQAAQEVIQADPELKLLKNKKIKTAN